MEIETEIIYDLSGFKSLIGRAEEKPLR